MNFASRVQKIPPYLFVEISRKIARKREEGIEVISFGIGDPDLETPAPVIEALRETAGDLPNHRYPESEGLPEFRKATADWYQRRFGISLTRRRGHIADRSQGGHRTRRLLLHRTRRHSPSTRSRISCLFRWHLVRRRRMPLDAPQGGERLAARSGRDTRGRGQARQGDVAQLSEQPHRRHRRLGLLRARRRVRQVIRHSRPSRRLLHRRHLRRLQASVFPGSQRRDGRGHGVPLSLQDLQHDRLAARNGGWERRDDQRPSGSEVQPRTPAFRRQSSRWA